MGKNDKTIILGGDDLEKLGSNPKKDSPEKKPELKVMEQPKSNRRCLAKYGKSKK